ncbi:sialidase family protein [Desertivirga arenae]|uniref:sialidase family protein n=1 Tax=Desertivirga arenae TaxID=2810309 RepID=UPI001A97CD0F|nr:sialidase family protein [Pedobacter sp. SYSU D00823]
MNFKSIINSIILLSTYILIVFTSCTNVNKVKELKKEQSINAGMEAVGPYLTHNSDKKAVLCWTAKDSIDSLNRVQYAIFDPVKRTFGSPVTVTSSIGCSHSPESMAKVAFKKDGTIIAVFARKFVKEKNPYAGAIYYSTSNDSGKTWSKPLFLHSDTSHHYGRNFFDLATLEDGEVAAIWLDGRFGKAQKGSALFFSRTERGKGFGADSCLNKSTCECCRTNLMVDNQGNIHVAYRSIQYPATTAGAQVRDMVYISSVDNGKSFTKEKAISNDNWKIEGCPHSGPSLAVSSNKVSAVWFSAAEGKAGLFFSTAAGGTFSKRRSLSTNGRHPQLTTLGQQILMVCEESDASPSPASHQGTAMSSHQEGASSAKVQLSFIENGSIQKSVSITDGTFADHHAVITPQDGNALIAWVRENKGIPTIYYTIKETADDK